MFHLGTPLQAALEESVWSRVGRALVCGTRVAWLRFCCNPGNLQVSEQREYLCKASLGSYAQRFAWGNQVDMFSAAVLHISVPCI